MIATQPNECRCATTHVQHVVQVPPCCPVSGNPQMGSTLSIAYTPAAVLLEVASLQKYINSYQGGRGAVRSMEGMIQAITKDCADTLGVGVEVTTDLYIAPAQRLRVTCGHG